MAGSELGRSSPRAGKWRDRDVRDSPAARDGWWKEFSGRPETVNPEERSASPVPGAESEPAYSHARRLFRLILRPIIPLAALASSAEPWSPCRRDNHSGGLRTELSRPVDTGGSPLQLHEQAVQNQPKAIDASDSAKGVCKRQAKPSVVGTAIVALTRKPQNVRL